MASMGVFTVTTSLPREPGSIGAPVSFGDRTGHVGGSLWAEDAMSEVASRSAAEIGAVDFPSPQRLICRHHRSGPQSERSNLERDPFPSAKLLSNMQNAHVAKQILVFSRSPGQHDEMKRLLAALPRMTHMVLLYDSIWYFHVLPPCQLSRFIEHLSGHNPSSGLQSASEKHSTGTSWRLCSLLSPHFVMGAI